MVLIAAGNQTLILKKILRLKSSPSFIASVFPAAVYKRCPNFAALLVLPRLHICLSSLDKANAKGLVLRGNIKKDTASMLLNKELSFLSHLSP